MKAATCVLKLFETDVFVSPLGIETPMPWQCHRLHPVVLHWPHH